MVHCTVVCGKQRCARSSDENGDEVRCKLIILIIK